MWAHFHTSNPPFAETSRLEPSKAKQFHLLFWYLLLQLLGSSLCNGHEAVTTALNRKPKGTDLIKGACGPIFTQTNCDCTEKLSSLKLC